MPFALHIESPSKNYDTGGMSVEGAIPRDGHLGAIVYGESAANHIRVEGDANLEARPPLHLGPVGLVFVGDIKLDDLGDRDRIGDLELGALVGNIAHQAIEAGAPIVEIQAPLQKASLTQERAAFVGGDSLQESSGAAVLSCCGRRAIGAGSRSPLA